MPALDPQLRSLLASLRRRVRQFIVADSLLAVTAVLLAAFWIGLLIDFVPVHLGGTEMPRSARTALLVVVGAAVIAVVIKLLVGRLRRPLPDDSLALLVERHHPQLGGRLVTAVQLSREGRSGDSYAPGMLRRVHAEAAAAVGGVETRRVFRRETLLKKVWVVLPLLAATILLAALSPAAFGRAAGRLLLLSDDPWPRQAALQMVGIELPSVSVDESEPLSPTLITFDNRTARLPRGSSGTLRIAAVADGAVVPEVCTVYFVSDDGTRGQANMRRVGRVSDGLQSFILDGPPLAGLTESVTIAVRGLDARLDGYRIEAVPPPALTRVQVVTTDPAYLSRGENAGDGKPAERITRRVDYQSGLRVREGADTRLTARSSAPLSKVEARLIEGGAAVRSPVVSLSDDGLEFTLHLEEMRRPATVVLVPEDRDGISAQVPFRYFLGVVLDEKPEIEMRLRGIGTAVTRNARIPIVGRATDDYAIASASVTLTTAPQRTEGSDEAGGADAAQGENNAGSSAQFTVDPDRDGDFELMIDLRDLLDGAAGAEIPEPGGAINLIGEASDHYDLDGREHRSTSQLYRLEVVTPENLLALLERRELALRSRLEQTIEETRGLRDSLGSLTPDLEGLAAAAAAGEEPVEEADDAIESEPAVDTEETPERRRQVLRLRSRQIGLQAAKTAEELLGIAASLDDILEEMQNNRVDSLDRSERIAGGVRDPLRSIVAGDLAELQRQIGEIEGRIGVADASPTASSYSAQSVQTAEQVILQLTEVLEKMLDLESYNEILDMLRELIENQEGLIEETKKEQRRSVIDLFN